MPKANKGKGNEAIHNDSKPYARHGSPVKAERSLSHSEQFHDHDHSPHPPKTASHPAPEPSASQRRRNKKKKRDRRAEEGGPATLPANGHTEVSGMNGAHPEANGSLSPNRSAEDVKPDLGSHEAVRRRLFGPDANDTERRHKHDAEVKELRKQVASMTQAEEEARKEAGRIAAELRARIEQLEQTVATQQADMTKTKDEMEVKEKLIHDHGSRSDSLRELLHCGVCMEPLDDPHTLQCGHSACRKCLHGWFRSANAYPAPDIEAIGEDDDMTYRTKTCHMCRTPVFRRPARNIILNHVLESVGLATVAAGVESASRAELDSMWTNIFPPEPKSWVVRDEHDNVNRCPRCGCEVDYGDCASCGATFSVTGSESDVSVFDFEGRVDLGNGLLLDQQLAGMDGRRNDLDQRIGRIHPFQGGLIDDEAEDDEDEDYAPYTDDDEDIFLRRTLNAAAEDPESVYDSEDSRNDFYDDEMAGEHFGDAMAGGHFSDSEGDYPGYGRAFSSPRRRSSDDEDDVDFVPPRPSPPARWGRSSRSVSRSGSPLLGRRLRDPSPSSSRQTRARRLPPPPESVMSDGSYDSSFINDGEDVEFVSDDELDAEDVSLNAGDRSEVDELADGGSDRGGSDVDEPSIEELRRRRAERYGASSTSTRRNLNPPRLAESASTPPQSCSPSPPPRTRTHRRRASPSSARESSIEPLDEAPTRRARAQRRQRVIESDDE